MAFRSILVVVLLVFATVIRFSAARAVNITNTWMLPEEGFPVFYRYFRDRISWYEADAVCQFHHAYLVTADSTSQYDAIRAYLKELDITDNVWIGLSKIPEKPDFTWTNFQPLTGEGHWQSTITLSSSPLCVAMDPARDFLWKPMTCGGPEVASFICELPIPEWALGPRGCLLTELPSLTVLYNPEQSSLELTSDCGLDGTKRIACKGDANREEILKQLTCAIQHEDFEEKTTKHPSGASTASFDPTENSLSHGKPTKTSLWTSNTIDIDYGMPTRHRRETEDTLSAGSTESTAKLQTTEKAVGTTDAFRATNYDTEVTTSSLLDTPTMDSTTLKTVSSETPSSAGIFEHATTIVEVAQTSTTISSSEPIDKDVSAEYPSAISQGQLFSIILNGTMFDLIELNETSDHELKTPPATFSAPKQKTELKPSTKLAQLAEKNSKNKPLSKKDIYKNSDPKKFSLAKTDLSKEVELFPIVHDDSVKLNRTFRKEVPEIPGESKSETGKEIATEKNDLKVTENKEAKILDTELSENDLQASEIDPNIVGLNTNMKTDNDSETVENVEPSTLEMQPTNEEQERHGPGADTQSTSASLQMNEARVQQKPNRQRQLTKPQRRSFYPYFFSRVLG